MAPKDFATSIVLIISLVAVGGAFAHYTYPPLVGGINDREQNDDAVTRVDDDLPHYDAQDGVFTTSIMYTVPNNHEETMVVTLTLEDNTVVATELSYEASNGTSQRYLDRFNDWHTESVVGKRIEDIELSRLGGASLTSVAFNNALTDIKEQARSTR